MRRPLLPIGLLGSVSLLTACLFVSLPATSQTQSSDVGKQGKVRPLPLCADSILDQNGTGCLQASSTPLPGFLFPPPHDGGQGNSSTGLHAFVGGGLNNASSGAESTVAGGTENEASGAGSTVVGGSFNTASGELAAIGGGSSNTATGYSSTVGGGIQNSAIAQYSTIAGGSANTCGGQHATIGGGESNLAGAQWSTIGGGFNNLAAGQFSTVAGGSANSATAQHASIGGGESNDAYAVYATIAGGHGNTIQGSGSSNTVGGGEDNIISAGSCSTIPGGRSNSATASYCFAAGRRAKANHDGAFVWGDSFDGDKTSSAPDEFNVYASGGVRIFSDSAATAGVLLAPGGGTWTSVSDREAKQAIQPVDEADVLERLMRIPIATWNYKAQSESIRHMGPMAQDFYAAFGLGLGERTIDTVDPDGVALAAIQGLNEKLSDELTEKERQLAAQEEEIAGLRSELEDLQRILEILMADARAPDNIVSLKE